jgi:hypothetical protein
VTNGVVTGFTDHEEIYSNEGRLGRWRGRPSSRQPCRPSPLVPDAVAPRGQPDPRPSARGGELQPNNWGHWVSVSMSIIENAMVKSPLVPNTRSDGRSSRLLTPFWEVRRDWRRVPTMKTI